MTERLGIPIPDLPDELKTVIHGHIRLFSVTAVARPTRADACSCAGTLCRIAGIRGILTARHAWEELRKEPEIYLLAGRAIDTPQVDPGGVSRAHRISSGDCRYGV